MIHQNILILRYSIPIDKKKINFIKLINFASNFYLESKWCLFARAVMSMLGARSKNKEIKVNASESNGYSFPIIVNYIN